MVTKVKNVLSVLGVFVALILSYVVSAVTLDVNEGDLVEFEKVKINGVTVYEKVGNNSYFYPTYVYPGEELTFYVLYKGLTNSTDVRVEAVLPGYEYNLIEDVSDNFEIVNGTYKYVQGTLRIPEDIEAGKVYPLKIEFLSDTNVDYIEIPLDIEKPPKYILDVDTQVLPKLLKYSFKCPSCAENKINVMVRLENRGKKTLKHVNVVAYLKEYPEVTKTVVYLYQNRDDQFNGQLGPGEVATLKGTIDLNSVPFSIPSGTYHVVVEVRYDYNHKAIKKEQTVEIVNIDELQKQKEENKTEVKKPQKVVATSSSIEVSVNPAEPITLTKEGESKIITLLIKNNENARIDLKVKVESVPQVVTEVNPPKVSIEPLGTATVRIKVSANEEGVYPLTIKLLNDNDEVIKVIRDQVEAKYNNYSQAVLLTIIIVLIVLIVAVIIALILKKNSDKVEREKIIIEKEKGPNIKVEEDELY